MSNKVELSLSIGFDQKTQDLIQGLIDALGNSPRATEARDCGHSHEPNAETVAAIEESRAMAKAKADTDAKAKAKADTERKAKADADAKKAADLAAKKQAEVDAALAAAEEKPAEIDPLADEPAIDDAPKATFEDVLKALSDYRDIEGTQAVVDLLAKYDAEHVKKLKPEHFADVIRDTK